MLNYILCLRIQRLQKVIIISVNTVEPLNTLEPANFTVIERLSSLRGKSGPVGTTELVLYREVSFIWSVL